MKYYPKKMADFLAKSKELMRKSCAIKKRQRPVTSVNKLKD